MQNEFAKMNRYNFLGATSMAVGVAAVGVATVGTDLSASARQPLRR